MSKAYSPIDQTLACPCFDTSLMLSVLVWYKRNKGTWLFFAFLRCILLLLLIHDEKKIPMSLCFLLYHTKTQRINGKRYQNKDKLVSDLWVNRPLTSNLFVVVYGWQYFHTQTRALQLIQQFPIKRCSHFLRADKINQLTISWAGTFK